MKNFFYVLTMLVIVVSTMFVGGCSSGEYGNEEEATDAQVAALKTRVLEIATEYGLTLSIDDTELRSHLNMSDEDIENDMKQIALIRGCYHAAGGKENTFVLKKSKRTRASGSIPSSANETWSGTASASASTDDAGGYEICVTVDYYCSNMGNDRLSISDATISYERNTGNYIIDKFTEPLSVSMLEYTISMKTFSFSAMYDYTYSGNYKWKVNGSLSGTYENEEMTIYLY